MTNEFFDWLASMRVRWNNEGENDMTAADLRESIDAVERLTSRIFGYASYQELLINPTEADMAAVAALWDARDEAPASVREQLKMPADALSWGDAAHDLAANWQARQVGLTPRLDALVHAGEAVTA